MEPLWEFQCAYGDDWHSCFVEGSVWMTKEEARAD